MIKQSTLVIGAGGHGREVADILRHAASLSGLAGAAGFIDDRVPRDTEIDGLRVLGDVQWLIDHHLEFEAVIAVGSPRICQHVAERIRPGRIKIVSAISPLARISPMARLGEGVIIFPNAVINAGTTINNHVTLNVAATVSHDSTVGAYSNLNPGAHIAGNVTIGEGCFIGMGANVIQQVRIGDWTTVGAGAVVLSDLPPSVTAVGVPARILNPLIPRKE